MQELLAILRRPSAAARLPSASLRALLDSALGQLRPAGEVMALEAVLDDDAALRVLRRLDREVRVRVTLRVRVRERVKNQGEVDVIGIALVLRWWLPAE